MQPRADAPHPAHPPLPTRPADLALFTVIADISILTLNLSLMLNTVSFYQVRGPLLGAGAEPLACCWVLVLSLRPAAPLGCRVGCWRGARAGTQPGGRQASGLGPRPAPPSPRPRQHLPTHLPARSPSPQIAKLLIIPFVCFVESSFLGRTFTREVSAAIVLVVAGVAVVTGAAAAGWGGLGGAVRQGGAAPWPRSRARAEGGEGRSAHGPNRWPFPPPSLLPVHPPHPPPPARPQCKTCSWTSA